MKTYFEIIVFLSLFIFFSPLLKRYINLFLKWGIDYSKPWKEKLELPRLVTLLVMLLVIFFFMKEANNTSNSLGLQYMYFFTVIIYVLASYLIWTKKFKEVVGYSPERFGIKGFNVVDYKRDILKKNFLRFNNKKIKINFEQFTNLLYLKRNRKLEPIIILDKGKNNSSANKMIVCELISVLFLETNPNLDKGSQNILLKKISINYLINSNNEKIELTAGDISRWRKKRTDPIEKFRSEIKPLLKSKSSNFYEIFKDFFRKKIGNIAIP